MTHWSEPFVGLPYAELGRDRAGVDCWGLVYLLYGEAFAIEVSSYAGDYADAGETAEISGLIDAAKATATWVSVKASHERPGDLVVFRRGRHDSHLGIIIDAQRGWMLHAAEGHGSRIESYRDGRWAQRSTGFYRHASRAGGML